MAASGVKWTSTSSITIAVLQFVQLFVLARLLSPDEFGLMAMVGVTLGFAAAYADMGVSAAIIHRQDATQEQLSSLYWLNLLGSFYVYLLVITISPVIVAFYGEPRLNGMIPWVALSFIINPFGTQFQLLLQKNLHFRHLALIEISSALVGAGVAIGSALQGQGVFSLIWGTLSNNITSTLLLLTVGLREWRPQLHFHRADLKGFLSFGFYQMGERSVNYLNSTLDQLLIGSLLGAQALGYYRLAWNLAIQPVGRINPIVTRVVFPLFSRIQNEIQQLRKGYLLVLNMLSMVNAPLLLGLAAISPMLIPFVLGEQWKPAVPLVQVLAFVTLMRSMGNPVGSLLLAKGRADLGFKWNCIEMVTQLPGVYLGAYFGGALGVAISLVILQVLYTVLLYPMMIKLLIGPCLREYVMSMLPALVLASVMGVGVMTLSWVAQVSIWVLGLLILFGMLLYSLLVLMFQRKQIEALKLMVLHR